MPKDITPSHLKCGLGQCPSVHELEDGRIAIRGEYVLTRDIDRLGLPDISGRGMEEDYVILPASWKHLFGAMTDA